MENNRIMKVMLLGDSIRLNYQSRVKQLLEDRAEILSPAENCRFSAYTLFLLGNWVPDQDYDVIHWNNGQWDVCYMPDGRIHTPLPAYLDQQRRIARILAGRSRRLIFATTSPVHDDQFTMAVQNGRKNEDIIAYNQAASRALAEMGVEINDLYTPLAQDVKRFICSDRVHLSPDGIECCAERVSAAILG